MRPEYTILSKILRVLRDSGHQRMPNIPRTVLGEFMTQNVRHFTLFLIAFINLVVSLKFFCKTQPYSNPGLPFLSFTGHITWRPVLYIYISPTFQPTNTCLPQIHVSMVALILLPFTYSRKNASYYYMLQQGQLEASQWNILILG